MSSLGLGLSASVSWAAANICLSLLADESEARDATFWMFLLQVLLIAPVALVGNGGTPAWDGVFWIAVAGVAGAAGLVLLNWALEHGPVGTVAPLAALEGPFAVAAGILSGKPASLAVVLGGTMALAGGALIAHRGHSSEARETEESVAKSSVVAIGAAALFGISLWALAHQSGAFASSMLLYRAIGLGVVLLTLGRLPRRPPDLRWPLNAAITDLAGTLFFLEAARSGSLPVAAVAATQFGTFAAIFGFVVWKEALTPKQVLGVAVVGIGIAVVASGAA